jgi:alpha-glucosidase
VASKSVVSAGNVRVSVLTSNIIRLQQVKSGADFAPDAPTLAVLNRQFPTPSFTQKVDKDAGTISVSVPASGFSLTVSSKSVSDSFTLKTPTTTSSSFSSFVQTQRSTSLFGTIRTLDLQNAVPLNCSVNADITVHDESLHCSWGLLSTSGVTMLNQTGAHFLTTDGAWWGDGASTDALDIYLFVYGSDYYKALQLFTQVSLSVPMTPRYSLGVAYSVWHNYDNSDIHRIVDGYRSRGIPLDIFVYDMQWHTKPNWGSYTFDNRLLPYPAATSAWLHEQGLHLTINIHDDTGIMPTEATYTQICEALGLDPATAGPIPFSIVNQSYMYAVEDIALGALEAQGVDFYWIDWQQGGAIGGAAGGDQNPTIMLNKLRVTDHMRRGEETRGLTLARWGGLGNHRYQAGFSGDVAQLTWSNLAYQPYFSATAANVLFPLWSHDVVGPNGDDDMYIRWVQAASVSGFFRTHDRGMGSGACANSDSCATYLLWDVDPEHFEANRDALQFRSSIVPYLYSNLYRMHKEARPLLRPMYYEFPKEAAAYSCLTIDGAGSQYMLGDDLIVSPVVVPPSQSTNLANVTVWIPNGTWVERDTGLLFNESASVTLQYHISEVPVFVRAGAIIPRLDLSSFPDLVGTAQAEYTTLVVEVWPGATSGSSKLYEDDGSTTNYYYSDAFVLTNLSWSAPSPSTRTIAVVPTSTGKGYPAHPATRVVQVRLVNHLPLKSATCNGDAASAISYDGPTLTAVVTCTAVDTSSKLMVSTTAIADVVDQSLSGLRGMIHHASLAKRLLDASWATPGGESAEGGRISEVSATGELLGYLAANASTWSNVTALIAGLPEAFAAAVSEVRAMDPSAGLQDRTLVQLWNAARQDTVLCGTTDCVDTNAEGYVPVWTEGYQAPASAGVALNDYWDPLLLDNLATTATSPPSGYNDAVFPNGRVYDKDGGGMIPLHTFFSADRNDTLTVGSQVGLWYAQENHYVQTSTKPIGWILHENPGCDVTVAGGEEEATSCAAPFALGQVNEHRWQQAMALLTAVPN